MQPHNVAGRTDIRMSLKAENRAKRILRILLQQGNTSVDDLVKLLDSSPASVRRDLSRMETNGLVRRTHGGASLAGDTLYEPFRFDAAFQIRENRFADEKLKIALAAADLIQDNDTIGLTAGTTTTQVARKLRHLKNLHIVTNALNIGMELSNQADLRVTMTGGYIRWPGAFSMVGPAALDSLEHIFVDKVFLGACGIDPVHGVTTIEAEEALLFRVLVAHSKQVVVLADSSKMGMVSPALTCKISEVDTIVTDDGIAPDIVEAFGKSGIRVVVA